MMTLVMELVFAVIIFVTCVFSFVVFYNKMKSFEVPPMQEKLENSDEKIADAVEFFKLTNVGL